MYMGNVYICLTVSSSHARTSATWKGFSLLQTCPNIQPETGTSQPYGGKWFRPHLPKKYFISSTPSSADQYIVTAAAANGIAVQSTKQHHFRQFQTYTSCTSQKRQDIKMILETLLSEYVPPRWKCSICSTDALWLHCFLVYSVSNTPDRYSGTASYSAAELC